MTSHIRHRRGLPYPDLIEPGELAVDPVNRQLTAGGIDTAAGVKVPLLAIRIFDPLASYLRYDYVVHAGSILRAIVAVPPGPFEPADWETLVGSTDQVHTPLHGFNDGDGHTLLLHNVVDDNTIANSAEFLNFTGIATARLWTTGQNGDTLRIQSSGAIALAPNHIGGDDTANKLVVGPTDVTIYQRGGNGGLVLSPLVNDSSRISIIDWRNASNQSAANMWAWANGAGFQIQSAGPINFMPSHPGIDGAGIALQVNTSNVHVLLGTVSGNYTQGALVVDGGAGIGGNLFVGGTINGGNNITANGNLTLGANASITNTSGYLVVQSAAALYLRSPAITYINDTSGAPVVAGGNLTVNGAFTGVQGGTFQNDLMVYRSGAPSTGLINFGNTGTRYLYFDGTDLTSYQQHIVTLNPTAGPHVATKAYVDAQISAAISGGGTSGGPFLSLAGGTMAGAIVSADSGDLLVAGPAHSFQVTGLGATWAAMAFAVPGVFGTNFGLRNDGNFWMGGWSHASAYKFWTTREVSLAPFSDIRLAFAADVFGPGAMPDPQEEPFPGAVITGWRTRVAPSPTELVRFRYMQVLIGSTWYTVTTVGP